METKELKEDVIYHMSVIGIENMKLCVIASNRKEDRQILNKQKTCDEVGMQIPAIFTDAGLVFDAGYVLKDIWTEKVLNREELHEYETPAEGNGRLWAYLMSLEKAKKDPTYKPFDYIFQYRKYPNAEEFKKAYRQMNQYNEQTTGKDYARDLLATNPNKVLKSYLEKVDYGMLPKAAGYATTCKEIDKKEIEKAFTAPVDKLPLVFSETGKLEYTGLVYEAVRNAFGAQKQPNNLIKTCPLWEWVAAKLNDTIDIKVETSKLVRMFENLNSKDSKALEAAKKEDKKSKKEVITALLDTIYLKIKD
ncbi:hypothetical protein [Bacteroides bouchesdurhonensis]|uniref:hypothetical protein n=1 Tax=Bacteroides bouchesdurhonensis TaxID=1841855 RepID=UPI0022E48753|nr:hypothetical protein [Bacteroides bouchesdurhonensis]